jgi:hypothetical protein
MSTVIRVNATSRAASAATVSVACGLTAMCAALTGCAATAHLASHSAPAAAETTETTSNHYCAYEIATPTAAEIAAINRYWTPLARSAVRYVSRGKILVPVPKKHLTQAQRQALGRAAWAWRTFSPKPELVCVPVPAGRGSRDATTLPRPRRAADKRE